MRAKTISQCGNKETSWVKFDTKLQNQPVSMVIFLGLKSHWETKILWMNYQVKWVGGENLILLPSLYSWAHVFFDTGLMVSDIKHILCPMRFCLILLLKKYPLLTGIITLSSLNSFIFQFGLGFLCNRTCGQAT